MPNVLVNSESLPVEVGEQVYWVKLETRKITKDGTSVIQYWAFLPPGVHPAAVRGKERQEVIDEVRQAIVAYTLPKQ